MKITKTYAATLIALASCIPLTATAQSVSNATNTQGLGLIVGYNSDYKRATLAYETPRLWSYQSENGWGKFDLFVELGLSYWDPKVHDSKSMVQFGAIPSVRWWPQESFYLELGSGPTVMSRTKFAGHNISTALQFGSRFGLGYLTQSGHQFGVRYSHFSNANIKKPNPGLDVVELMYLYNF